MVAWAGPEPESEHAHTTVTGPLFHPAPLAGVRLCTEIDGAVLSILTGPTFVLATLPALSRQLPVTVVPLVSEASVVPPVGLPGATPERLSEQLNDTVTLPVFQPEDPGGGAAEPLIVGAVV